MARRHRARDGPAGRSSLSRALNGVSRPIFYKGEQVGERVYYNERLTQFLLRSNMPEVYGRWRDRVEWQGKPDAAMPAPVQGLRELEFEAYGRAYGIARSSVVADPSRPENPEIDAP